MMDEVLPGRSPVEQLNSIDKAIEVIQSGAQSYRIGNRQLNRPDLSLLYSERNRIQAEIAAEKNGGVFSVAVFSGR